MKFRFLKYSKIYFSISLSLAILSIVAVLIFGLNWGIDFVGGSILDVSYSQTELMPSQQDINSKLKEIGLDNFSVRLQGEMGIVVRIPEVPQALKDKLLDYFYNAEGVDIEKIGLESVSPVIGGETKTKAINAIFYAVIAIVIYVAIVFRKVSKPIKSWQYGIATVIALIHDVLIPVGALAILGHFWGVEFSIPILTALLTIFGYSVNDTVVVFDRIRENLIMGKGETFDQIVDESLNQTLVRSINTSFTTLFVLLALFFFGGESLTWFSFALIIGTIAGTYSSIFLASTLLAKWLAFSHRNS